MSFARLGDTRSTAVDADVTHPYRDSERVRDVGTHGERIAERYLVRRGWYPLGRNLRVAGVEVDLIMKRLGILAIVEVKVRSHPLDVDEPLRRTQRERIIRAASVLTTSRPEYAALTVRLDVVVIDRTGPRRRVRHYPGAFDSDPSGKSVRESWAR